MAVCLMMCDAWCLDSYVLITWGRMAEGTYKKSLCLLINQLSSITSGFFVFSERKENTFLGKLSVTSNQGHSIVDSHFFVLPCLSTCVSLLLYSLLYSGIIHLAPLGT